MLFKTMTIIMAVLVMVPAIVPATKATHHIQTLALSQPLPILRFREWEKLQSQHQLQYREKKSSPQHRSVYPLQNSTLFI